MIAENKSKCVVVVSCWQIQCCGTPFQVGDKVEWLVLKYKEVNTKPRSGAEVEYYYEFHSSDWKKLYKITGIVDELNAEYYSLELRPPTEKLPKGSKELIYKKTVKITKADIWEKDIDGLEFEAYIVTLRDFTILPAKQEEVTFS